MSSPTRTRRTALRQALAPACLGAGAIHLALVPEHLHEWALLGVGFAAAGLLQLVWAVQLWRTESRRWLGGAALGSALFALVWLVSRTTGLPFAPEAGAEPVGAADLLCVALELAVAGGAVALLRRPAAGRAPARRTGVLLAGTTLAVLAATGVALASPGHEHGLTDGRGGPCPARPVPSGVDANHDGADDGVQAYFACELRHEHDHHHAALGSG